MHLRANVITHRLYTAIKHTSLFQTYLVIQSLNTEQRRTTAPENSESAEVFYLRTLSFTLVVAALVLHTNDELSMQMNPFIHL